MDQLILESLQHLRLTKEEEEDVAISTISRSDLLEECALSLFGKLLSDRQQNQKALKSTLRTTWKMGSKLRIVDVGKDILHFKFTSEYQMEWVERNGPWNFDNNLLLLCRWKKRLISVQYLIYPLPFLASQVYENLGGLAGKQNSSQRSLLGHDEWHCASFLYNPDSPKQYGVWLKAGGNSKDFSDQSRSSSSRSQDSDRRGRSGDGSGEKPVPVTASRVDLESDQRVNLNFQNSRQIGQDVVLEKWGKSEGSSTKVKKNIENRYGVETTDSRAQLSNPTREQHVERDSGKGPSEAYSLVGFINSSANEAHEITSPLKANMDQLILESLQHLRLTKEEEEDVAISTISRSDLLEECALSLFGKLLSDRQQNQKALKSTLRTAWKMGSKLRIVDVGKDILQFKFTSEYQMEWVERNGPWNFDSNLLLLCRWKKGLSVSNISFTHSPFWVTSSTWIGAKHRSPSNLKGSPVFASNAVCWVTMNGIVLASSTIPILPNNMGFGSKQVKIQRTFLIGLDYQAVGAKTVIEGEDQATVELKNPSR
nr:hypothetical protein CFP56_37939 [Quercus suber]